MKKIEEMSLEELVGQLIVYRASESSEDILQLAEQGLVGGIGITYFPDLATKETRVAYINKLIEKSAIMPFVLASVDSEQLFPNCFPKAPSEMALGATGNLELITKFAQLVTSTAWKNGINYVWEPTVDINTNPDNPIIGTRAFSDKLELVNKCALAYLAGVNQNKIMLGAKHFPGHGATSGDSHVRMNRLNSTLDELLEWDLVPYKKLIEHDLSGIMSAHLVYPKIDSEHPVTFSRKFLIDILRQQLGFSGILVSDSLTMKALNNYGDANQKAVAALCAGHDIILEDYNVTDPRETLAAILASVKSGELPLAEVKEKVSRILRYKEKLAKYHHQGRIYPVARDRGAEKATFELYSAIAKASLTLLENRHIPDFNNEKIMVLGEQKIVNKDSIIDFSSEGESDVNLLLEQLETTFPQASTMPIEATIDDATFNKIIIDSQDNEWIIFVLDMKILAYNEDSSKIKADYLKLINELKNSNIKIGIIAFGNPYFARFVDDVDFLLLTYSNSAVYSTAITEYFKKPFHLTGTLPITINEKYHFGYAAE
jgi:beta-N-acetylhexosaminidase